MISQKFERSFFVLAQTFLNKKNILRNSSYITFYINVLRDENT